MDPFKLHLAAGEVLFEHGDEGNCAYIVESGAIEILRSADGLERVVARLGPGEIFGEMALFGEHTRSAGARAAEATVLTRLTHDYIAERVQSAAPMLPHMLPPLTRRSRELLEGRSRPATAEDVDR